MTSFSRIAFRTTLIASGLVLGLGNGTVDAATGDASMLQPQSDNSGAAVTGSAIATMVKVRLEAEDSLKKYDINAATTNAVARETEVG